jgi:hypothetical protein
MRLPVFISAMALLSLPAFAAGCGKPPAAPKPPLGCKAMPPACICDAKGDCHWDFLCERE